MKPEAALDRINELTPSPEQVVMRAKLRGLLRGYVKRWADQQLEVVEIETLATSDLYNPATQAKSRSFTVAGKKDVLLMDEGRMWLMDHKTTSDEIEDPNCSYHRQLIVEGQHHHYALLEHLNGRRVDGAIWDVTRKPGISPRQITKAEQTEIIKSGLWFGDPAEVTERETPAMFESRVAWDCTEIRPQRYFQRWRIARLDQALIEYAGELWAHSQDMLWARRQGTFPRNSGACMNYGRACKYLGICSGYDDAESQNWQKAAWVHPELPIIEGDKDVLTNSRIRCFQTCRKKEYYQYQLGLVRVDEEEAETLFFGSCWHAALACWFEGFRKQNTNVNATSGNQATEVGTATGCED
ncbi:MAG: PD-(D/E)XK nuclease family protein [Bryobacteraceae bacterium]